MILNNQEIDLKIFYQWNNFFKDPEDDGHAQTRIVVRAEVRQFTTIQKHCLDIDNQSKI